MKKIDHRKCLKELGIIMSWVAFSHGKVSIESVGGLTQFSIVNNEIDFEYVFDIRDLKAMRGANRLLCYWANFGFDKAEDSNGKPLDCYDNLMRGLMTG